MRKFAMVPPTVWKTEVKKLRGDPLAISVYYHLTTSPHSTMIGIFPYSVIYPAHELGIPLGDASKGLGRVIEAGMATYDEELELVWVHDMALAQIAAELKPSDNRAAGVAKQIGMLPICPITLGFYKKYGEIFRLRGHPGTELLERALEGPSIPLRSKEKEKEQNKEQEKEEVSGSGQESLAPTHTRVHPQAREAEHPDWYEVDWNFFDSKFAEQIECGDSEFQAKQMATAKVERARQRRMEKAA